MGYTRVNANLLVKCTFGVWVVLLMALVCWFRHDLQARGVERRILIDCSHGNSSKDYRNQPKVCEDVATQVTAGAITSFSGPAWDVALLLTNNLLGCVVIETPRATVKEETPSPFPACANTCPAVNCADVPVVVELRVWAGYHVVEFGYGAPKPAT
jgi:hypothetical protein